MSVRQPAVVVEGLRYAYPDGQEALLGVDLQVIAGERVALLGPNGAGKTTLALHLNGILTPSRGRVIVEDRAVGPETVRRIRQQVGIVFQDSNDQLFMPTVHEDVAFGPANLGMRGAELDRRVEEALAAVGVDDVAGRAPHHLSGGERRLAAIATVLAMRPAILVLDEPTAGLDPSGRRRLIEALADLDVTQLVITHDLPFALETCPRTIVMDRGRVVAEGATGELLGDSTLLTSHGLEMPYAIDPTVLAPPASPAP